MPLGRAKDSYLNLLDLQSQQQQQQSGVRHAAGADDGVSAAVPSRSKKNGARLVEWLEDVSQHQNEEQEQEDEQEEAFWELTDNVKKYERILPLVEKKEQKQFCLPQSSSSSSSSSSSFCWMKSCMDRDGSCWPSCWANDVKQDDDETLWNGDSHNAIIAQEQEQGEGGGTGGGETTSGSMSSRSGGIVRRASMASQIWLGLPHSTRRSFRPLTYEPREVTTTNMAGGNTGTRHHHVTFAPFLKVVTIRPLHRYTLEEKSILWWQLQDYTVFQMQMALLIKSEEMVDRDICAIWLVSKQNTNNNNKQGNATNITAGFSGNPTTSTSNVGLPMEPSDHDDSSFSPEDTSTTTITTTNVVVDNNNNHHHEDDDLNWWHKYQHSRRGLERYVSTRQAEQTMENYNQVIRVVLREQCRQRFFCRPNPTKLATIYHEYTAWSRDLALAAGASDADAVKTNFDDSKRKTREYYLLKQLIQRNQRIHKHMPEFMLPAGIQPQGYLEEDDEKYNVSNSILTPLTMSRSS